MSLTPNSIRIYGDSWLSLEDLKDQLFLSPEMNAEELLEELKLHHWQEDIDE
ncbi:MAG: hypothetical protein HRT88_07205 [Lentisphaeraceae bacterium]|nr:hypothetical protein [Lentisphaeraceae bacterium]